MIPIGAQKNGDILSKHEHTFTHLMLLFQICLPFDDIKASKQIGFNKFSLISNVFYFMFLLHHYCIEYQLSRYELIVRKNFLEILVLYVKK
jgi:hypothetical protein